MSCFALLLTGMCSKHCVKCVRIESYSGSHFPAFGLNTESTKYLFVFSPNAGK